MAGLYGVHFRDCFQILRRLRHGGSRKTRGSLMRLSCVFSWCWLADTLPVVGPHLRPGTRPEMQRGGGGAGELPASLSRLARVRRLVTGLTFGGRSTLANYG